MKLQIVKAAFVTGLLAIASAAVALAQAPAVEPRAVEPAQPEPAQTTRQYEVEILIFAHQEFDPSEELFDRRKPGEIDLRASQPVRREAPRLSDLELEPLSRPNEPGLSQTPAGELGTAGQPGANVPPDARFRMLQTGELRLKREQATLQRLGAYTPILHAGWVQDGLPENQARAFNLAQLGTLNPTGTIRLYLSRFLNLVVDLTYQPRTATSSGASELGLGEFAMPPRYTIRESRTARSGELHYFDHPAFGVLISVRPVQRDEPARPGAPVPAA